MKRSITICCACLLAGFAAGWLSRPVGGPSDHPGSFTKESRGEKEAALPTRKPRAAEEEDEDISPPVMGSADRERMIAKCRRELEVMLAASVRELGLDDATAARLRAGLDGVIARAEPPVIEVAGPMWSDFLESVLSEDRRAEMSRLSQARADELGRAKVDARLAEMRMVMHLDSAQQEALRDYLAASAGSLPDPSRPPSPGLSPDQVREVQARLMSLGDDGSRFTEIASEVIREEMAHELEALSGILAEDQLEAYRLHLEARHQVFLGNP